MTPRSLAKFALLILNQGRMNGQQIIAKDWTRQSLSANINVDGNYRYEFPEMDGDPFIENYIIPAIKDR
ncbi:MAG: hypothetical protein HQK53_01360 [Oligoflexia bacterium]|nr:hypothetical protein [Oligoflexia bacterium]